MWFSKSPEEVLKELDANPSTGLSSEEAKTRIEKYGETSLKENLRKALFLYSLPN